MNSEALETGIQLAFLLNCEIPEEIHVMRKNVIDGSNPSGFQRTAVVGMNGTVETSFGTVGIVSVALEEDSAQILEHGSGKRVFGLNRLGIPLIEISTAPDIRTPEQGKELAEKLGMILRSCNVRRGLGSIRQDLNVSITGGSRIEIKGVQDLKGIPQLAEKEIKRQLQIIKKGKHVPPEVRKAHPDGSTSFLRPLPGAARLYPETDCLPIHVDQDFLKAIKANLPELLADKHERLTKEMDIPTDMVRALEKAGSLQTFSHLTFKNVNPKFIATTLLSYASEIAKKHPRAQAERITRTNLKEIFQALDQGKIPKDAVLPLLTDAARGKGVHLKNYAIKKVNLDSEVEQLLKTKPGLSFGAYMGILMKKHRGHVPGEAISQALKKHLSFLNKQSH